MSGRAAAVVGLIGFGALFVYEVIASFAPAASKTWSIPAVIGGVLGTAWSALIARRPCRLA